MKESIVVVGGGAIGGTVAAYLHRTGVPVRLVDTNAAHVAAICDRGLYIRAYDEEFAVPVRADTPETFDGSLKKVFLATKALHTTAAMEWIGPRLDEDGWVVSLQNGLNESVIAEHIGTHRTIGCFVNFSSDVMAAGAIDYGGPGTFAIGELDGSVTPRVAEVAEHIRGFLDPIVTPNIWGYLWSKLAYGALLFATATTDETMADCVDHPRYREALIRCSREVVDLAAIQHIDLWPFDGWDPRVLNDRRDTDAMLDRLSGVMRKNLKVRSGVWRDLAVHHRKTEIDAQYGPVMDVAQQYHYPMPVLEALVSIIHGIERQEQARGWHNLEQLLDA